MDLTDPRELAYYIEAGDVLAATANPDSTITLTFKNAEVTIAVIETKERDA